MDPPLSRPPPPIRFSARTDGLLGRIYRV